MITKEDVLQVARSLKMSVTDEQIELVLTAYPAEYENDPTGTWDLIVKYLLYTLVKC